MKYVLEFFGAIILRGYLTYYYLIRLFKIFRGYLKVYGQCLCMLQDYGLQTSLKQEIYGTRFLRSAGTYKNSRICSTYT